MEAHKYTRPRGRPPRLHWEDEMVQDIGRALKTVDISESESFICLTGKPIQKTKARAQIEGRGRGQFMNCKKHLLHYLMKLGRSLPVVMQYHK